MQVNIFEAKSQLSKLVQAARDGANVTTASKRPFRRFHAYNLRMLRYVPKAVTGRQETYSMP